MLQGEVALEHEVGSHTLGLVVAPTPDCWAEGSSAAVMPLGAAAHVVGTMHKPKTAAACQTTRRAQS